VCIVARTRFTLGKRYKIDPDSGTVYLGGFDPVTTLAELSPQKRSAITRKNNKAWSQWDNIYGQYQYEYWNKHPKQIYKDITAELWDTGKIHQPRNFGQHVQHTPYVWMDLAPPTNIRDKNPCLKEAWDHYVTLAGLFGAPNSELQF